MSSSDFIIEVSEADFEYQVLVYSQNVPVIVDFWAEWCAPCRTLGPILEKLAHQAQGDFRLAKLNVDENPNLAIRYGVRSIPVIKAFRDGEMISELIGLQPEARILEFIRSIAPSQSDLLVEKGFSLLAMQEAFDAQETFLEALEDDDEDTKALLGLAMSLLLQGKGAESFQILEDFPTSREFKKAEVLFPLSEALLAFEIKDIAESDYPLDAAFHNAIRLVKRDNMEAAMDGLLYILREDKHYADERARKVIVAILELLGDQDPIAREYRKELASVLF